MCLGVCVQGWGDVVVKKCVSLGVCGGCGGLWMFRCEGWGCLGVCTFRGGGMGVFRSMCINK